MRLSRTTGAGAGLLVLILGLWAGFSPFVGPYFHYGFAPDEAWHYTTQRLWLDILPAAVAVLGGLLMISAVRRSSGILGSWLALLGGAWLILGPSASLLWGHTAPGALQSGIGTPLGGHVRTAFEMIGVFYGVGGLIAMLCAFAIGRFALAAPIAAAEPAVARREEAATAAAERPERRGLIRRRRRRGPVEGEREPTRR